MTARVAAARVAAREDAGQKIGGNRKAPEQLELPLPEARGLRIARFAIHIVAMLLQDKGKEQTFSKRENRKAEPVIRRPTAIGLPRLRHSASTLRNGCVGVFDHHRSAEGLRLADCKDRGRTC